MAPGPGGGGVQGGGGGGSGGDDDAVSEFATLTRSTWVSGSWHATYSALFMTANDGGLICPNREAELKFG